MIKKILLSTAIITSLVSSAAAEEKWISLFNGENLDGWTVKFSGFEVGNNYTNRGRVYYLCIANAMSDGVEELVRKVGLFEVYLRENKVRYEGKVDCVGGLEVY